MKTAISIPDEIFAQAEEFAKRQKMSRSSLFTAAVDEYIHHHREEGVTQKLNKVYGSETSTLNHVLAELQARSLPREEW